MYIAQGQGQITPKILMIPKQFYFFNHTLQVSAISLKTNWENDFSTFSPYKCKREQIWPRHKKVKGQSTVIIWTNLVDLESPMLCTKIQPQSFFGFAEEDF